MQDDEYISLLEKEWQKVLGNKDEVTAEEAAELHRLLEEAETDDE